MISSAKPESGFLRKVEIARTISGLPSAPVAMIQTPAFKARS